MTNEEITDKINTIDTVDLRNLLNASELQMTISDSLPVSSDADWMPVEMTFDIRSFRIALSELLTR